MFHSITFYYRLKHSHFDLISADPVNFSVVKGYSHWKYPNLVALTLVIGFCWTTQWNWLNVSKRNVKHSEKWLIQWFSDKPPNDSQKLELSVNFPKLWDQKLNRPSVHTLSYIRTFIMSLYSGNLSLGHSISFHHQYTLHLLTSSQLSGLSKRDRITPRHITPRPIPFGTGQFSSNSSIEDVNILSSPYIFHTSRCIIQNPWVPSRMMVRRVSFSPSQLWIGWVGSMPVPCDKWHHWKWLNHQN
jgi:hypothetical protein